MRRDSLLWKNALVQGISGTSSAYNIVGTYVFTHIRFHAQYITAGYFENVTLYYVIAFCLFTLTMTLSNCDKICEKFSLER